MQESAEEEIQQLLDRWEEAVRNRDIEGIMASHAEKIVLFDVPPPVVSNGKTEYRASWDQFFRWYTMTGDFRLHDVKIFAEVDLAFCYGRIHCVEHAGAEALPIRFTAGFRRVKGKWWFAHEHHSLPSVS